MTQEDIFFWQVFFTVISFVLLLGLVKVVIFVHDFYRELRRLNLEISRTGGKERSYWKSQKRRLWLSLLPFIHY